MNSDQKGKRIAGFVLIGFGSFFAAMGVLLGGALLIAALVTNGLVEQQQEDLEDFKDHAVKTTGTVLEADDEHTVTVVGYFDEDGIWYETEFSVYYSKYGEGSNITVYYDEKNPDECMAPELTEGVTDIVAPILYGAGGVFLVVFLLIGIPMIIGGIVLKKKTDQK